MVVVEGNDSTLSHEMSEVEQINENPFEAMVAVLREQLAEEREARRRADTIIAQLAQSNEEQARTIRAIDSPRDEQNEGQETPGPGPEGPHTPGEAKPGEGNSGRRGLWRSFARRIFGRGW